MDEHERGYYCRAGTFNFLFFSPDEVSFPSPGAMNTVTSLELQRTFSEPEEFFSLLESSPPCRHGDGTIEPPSYHVFSARGIRNSFSLLPAIDEAFFSYLYFLRCVVIAMRGASWALRISLTDYDLLV